LLKAALVNVFTCAKKKSVAGLLGKPLAAVQVPAKTWTMTQTGGH
jgi:hypothetical protein